MNATQRGQLRAPVQKTLLRIGLCFLPLLLTQSVAPCAEQLAPVSVSTPTGEQGPMLARYSDRSLTLGIEIDRDGARLVSYTLKDHPFIRPFEVPEPEAYAAGHNVQVEILLHGARQVALTQRLYAGPLCLTHGPQAAPHVEGDTILLHRDTFIVEVPEVSGFDRVEIAFYEKNRGQALRRSLGSEKLDRARFTPAGGPHTYQDLIFADPADDGPSTDATSGVVYWPEYFEDPDIYRIYGVADEGAQRINVVIIPDGYAYTNKATMEAHADALVLYFRQKTPYAEHDPFVNYTLVYAYSRQDGTDECDCDVIVDTAMGTRFPDAGYPCGDSGNRCLYYGSGCDTSGTGNIVAAELRAPHHDKTIVMVNTQRYGGCGGARAVYSAGAGSATEIAVHELGHSLGGLADEYGGNPGCGTWAGEINTSLDSSRGAWFEWISELGPPREGAQYYNQCIYRPQDNCDMRSLNQPFCAVCNQHWALVFFGHPRVNSTAPIKAAAPSSPLGVYVGVPEEFSVDLRLAAGPAVTNDIEWSVQGPGDLEPITVATGVAAYTHTFDEAGEHSLRCLVTADTNFIKPFRYGANIDEIEWTVQAEDLTLPPEISPPGALQALLMTDKQAVVWEDASSSGVFTYNLYRGLVNELPGKEYGSCYETDIVDNETLVTDSPPQSICWFFLVTGANPVGEGPMGQDSVGAARTSSSPCE